MKKILAFVQIIFCFVLLLTGCPSPTGGNNGNGNNGNGNNGNSGNKALSKMSLVDAAALFIAPQSGSRQSVRAVEDGPVTLWKITEDGAVEEVTYYTVDEEGNETAVTETFAYIPKTVHNVNVEYIIVCFDGGPGDCLVRKSDGSVFSLSNTGRPDDSSLGFYINQRLIYTDDGGNIYYITYTDSSKVVKINTTDPSNLTSIQYSSTMDYVHYFAADSAGNMIYGGHNNGNQNSRVNRLKKASGAMQNIVMDSDSDGMWDSAPWTAPDGNLYYFVVEKGNTLVKKYNTVSDTIENFGSFAQFTSAYYNGLVMRPREWYLLSSDSRALLVNSGKEYGLPDNDYTICEIYPDTRKLPKPGLKRITGAAVSKDYYYLTGKDTNNNTLILKYDFATDTPAEIYQALEIYSFTVSDTDEVVFNAMRSSDGKKIVGKIAADSTVTTLEESANFEITVLERIN